MLAKRRLTFVVLRTRPPSHYTQVILRFILESYLPMNRSLRRLIIECLSYACCHTNIIVSVLSALLLSSSQPHFGSLTMTILCPFIAPMTSSIRFPSTLSYQSGFQSFLPIRFPSFLLTLTDVPFLLTS